MIPIVTHYGGFQSYGKMPYTSLKPGHKTLDFDDIYEKCNSEYRSKQKIRQDRII
jgi:hypothetical protein